MAGLASSSPNPFRSTFASGSTMKSSSGTEICTRQTLSKYECSESASVSTAISFFVPSRAIVASSAF
jgi:hypothetical protein